MATAVEHVENAHFGRKLSPDALDELCARRESLKAELEAINDTLKGQVEEHGFTPAGAEKSKRLAGKKYQATVTYGTSTEVRDAQVETIEKACPRDLFAKLFSKVTKYKLQSGASLLLAGTLPSGSPPNLRKMFSAAVVLKQREPSLSIKALEAGDE